MIKTSCNGFLVCQIKDPNMIKENYEEYVVEFSITIVDPTYSELLSDPAAPQYNDITKELKDKVRLYSLQVSTGTFSYVKVLAGFCP